MSTYSLEILDAEKYQEEFEQNIRYSFEQYLYKKNFRIGSGILNDDELDHNLIFSRILCSERCEIVNYLKDSISGKLKVKNKKKRKLLDLHREHEDEHKSMYNNEEQRLYWESASW